MTTVSETRGHQPHRAYEPSSERLLVLAPGGARANYWRDLWAFRELFLILAWRDLAIRYKQTVIGVAWAVIKPLLTTLVFTVVFSRIAKVRGDGSAPYALTVMAGSMAWTLFSAILSEGSASLVQNANLITKVYFPRLVIPAATVITALVDMAITLIMFFLLAAAFRFMPDWRLLTLPLFIALAVLASLGPALMMTALNVKYRDFRYIIPFAIQIGAYVCPVGYSSAAVPPAWRLAYSLNPAVGVIDGFRWALLGGQATLYPAGLFASIGVSLALLVAGIAYFRDTERTLADLI